jgi:hypothetical protein
MLFKLPKRKIRTFIGIIGLVIFAGACQRDVSDLKPPGYPAIPEVFIDGFSPGLNYAAFAGSVPTAFDVDTESTYDGSAASMRFEVPDVNDPRGAYVGGAFFTSSGRDLSDYTALTFWIKASQSATIDVIGFGNDLASSRFLTTLQNLPVNSNWTKVIIPIPDPSKLNAERGMLFVSEGPENSKGYTFWIDEVKFEKLGTLAYPRGSIYGGEDVRRTAETGEKISAFNLSATFNLPSGIDISVSAAPAYFDFSSSDTAVVTIDPLGTATVIGQGEAIIRATLGGQPVSGSLTINSSGEVDRPISPAPAPIMHPDSVISMYSNTYNNVPVDTWNTRWQFSTTDEFFIQIEGNDVIRYRNLNFVGIEFSSQTIDATKMTNFYMDIWTPDNTDPPRNFKVLLVDFGPNGVFGGGDDTSHEVTIARPTLTTGNWVRIDIPLSLFSGLTRRSNLAQLVLSGDLPNVFVDNILFYQKSGGTGETAPSVPAPIPTHNAANVISVFSDTYTNIPGTNLNPNWGQATMVSQVSIGGNNTLRYGGLNYQGIQLGSNQNLSSMTHVHLDFWTANAITLKVFLISPGPVETPYTLLVPTVGWSSIDIPLSSFAPVNLSNVIQFKFEGNGNVYLDNIYFRR